LIHLAVVSIGRTTPIEFRAAIGDSREGPPLSWQISTRGTSVQCSAAPAGSANKPLHISRSGGGTGKTNQPKTSRLKSGGAQERTQDNGVFSMDCLKVRADIAALKGKRIFLSRPDPEASRSSSPSSLHPNDLVAPRFGRRLPFNSDSETITRMNAPQWRSGRPSCALGDPHQWPGRPPMNLRPVLRLPNGCFVP
jgi:hypothetical protein